MYTFIENVMLNLNYNTSYTDTSFMASGYPNRNLYT